MAATGRDLYQARVGVVVDYINAHLDETLNLEHLAGMAGFSPFHFHRIFTAMLGETPNVFLQRVRLERAANLLVKNYTRPVTQIALDCGFSSSAVFARAFRQHFGCAPSEYRRARRIDLPATLRDAPAWRGVAAIEAGLRQVQVRPVPAWDVIYVANLEGYSLAKICVAWEQLGRWAAARDLITPNTRAIGIGYDDPFITPKERCRYYACLTVPGPQATSGRVGYLQLPAGRYAVASFLCAADEIRLTYQSLYDGWLPESGYQPADRPAYELYVELPEQNTAGLFRLEVYLPVEPL